MPTASTKDVESLLEKHMTEHDAVFRALHDRNYCLCCGQLAQHYGSGWMGTGGSGSCTEEVCVFCLESGCWGKDGKGCFGYRLAQPPAEIHDNCTHA